jgi:hypothetical protein
MWLPERRLASHPESSSFIFFSAKRSLIRPKTSVNGFALLPAFFISGSKLIVVVGLHRLLIDLDRRPQTVFHQLHKLDLVAQMLLQVGFGSARNAAAWRASPASVAESG